MALYRSTWFEQSLPLLIEKQELPSALMADAIEALTSGTCSEAEAAAFLTALRMKGETAGEITAAVAVLREKMVRLNAMVDGALDTCGTGGDGSGTFNISTAVALVVAAAGCPVVKHGNRSVSSRSGSADVLAALGVPVERGPAWAQACLHRFGFAFCFAPHFHPVLARVAVLRRRLGVRTIFNLLGPLLNPASAPHQVIGVGHANLLDPIAGAVVRLSARRSYVVCSMDGLDEVALSAATHVRHVEDASVAALQWTHRDFGLGQWGLHELKADGPGASAAIIRGVLAGQPGAPREFVLANASAGLLAAGRVNALDAGVAAAAEAIDSGKAARLLSCLCES